jgi:F0F1-type ATP synthase assembly protein I
MFNDLFTKLYTAANPAKVALLIQLLVLVAFIIALAASQNIALAGFADGGIGGGGPNVNSIEILY